MNKVWFSPELLGHKAGELHNKNVFYEFNISLIWKYKQKFKKREGFAKSTTELIRKAFKLVKWWIRELYFVNSERKKNFSHSDIYQKARAVLCE